MSDYDIESGQETEVAGFVSKTFQILNNEEYSKIVFWGPSGRDFIIKDVNKFQEVILPKYFRHQKINSFIRQLNMYGFHKSRKDSSKSIFSHPDFMKNRQDLLASIKRKIKTSKTEQKTPIKQKISTLQQKKLLETAQKSQFPSEKNLLENNMGGNLKGFFDSREFLNSRINLNVSLRKISMKNLQDFQVMFGNEASIQLEMQMQIEKQKNEDVKIQNPSFFFRSEEQE